MGNRIKQLRKWLGLTQQKFADRLGVKQNTIAQYEIGRNSPVDSVIALICREFNVSEAWLRTGEGEMFVPASSNTLDMLTREYELSHDARVLVEEFVNLKPEMQQIFIDFARKAAEGFRSEPPAPTITPAAPSAAEQNQLSGLVSSPNAADASVAEPGSDMAARVAALESQLAAEKARANRAEAEAREARAEAKARTDELLEVYREDEAAAAEGWKELPVGHSGRSSSRPR